MSVEEFKKILDELNSKPRPDFKKLLEDYLSLPKHGNIIMRSDAMNAYESRGKLVSM